MRFIKFFLILLTVTALHAQTREEVNINFKDLSIEDFLKMSAKILDKNILITSKISGEVDFISTNPIYKDEVLDLIISILNTKGITLVEDGNYLKTVQTSVASRENLPVVRGASNSSLMVTKVIKLESENVDIVVQKIRHLISHSAKLVTMKESNTMVISDFPSNITTILKVIDVMVNQKRNEVEIVSLHHASAASLLPQLVAISTNLINQRVAENKFTLLKDDASNAIVMIGTRDNLRTMRKVIDQLDIEEQIAKSRIEIIQLQNSDAEEIAKVLTNTLTKIKTKAPKTAAAKTPLNILAEKEINALIAIGTLEEIKQIKEMIAKLDVPRQQVYVKATIVEITEGVAEQVGLRYGLEAGAVGGSGLYNLGTTLTGSATPATTLASQAGLKLPSNLDSALILGVGLDFLKKNSAAEVLSEPSVLCVNNKESEIKVGQTRSISTGTNNNGTSTVNTFKRIDIGLTLKVKPRISTDKKVTLEAEASLEDLLGLDTSGQPITTNRNVKTVTIVNDGEPVIIGGLIKTNTSDADDSIPYLSSLPLIGSLFTGSKDDQSKTDLVIILTPYIVASSEDMDKLRTRLSDLENIRHRYSKKILERLGEGNVSDSESLSASDTVTEEW